MIEALVKARNEQERLLEYLRAIFLVICLVGYVFYSVEHWVLGHFLSSWQSKIPFYVSAVGFPLTLLMFFRRTRLVRYPFLIWMLVTFLTGLLGVYFHLAYNASDSEVNLWSIAGLIEATRGARPVLAPLLLTHVGAFGLLVGLTIRDRGGLSLAQTPQGELQA